MEELSDQTSETPVAWCLRITISVLARMTKMERRVLNADPKTVDLGKGRGDEDAQSSDGAFEPVLIALMSQGQSPGRPDRRLGVNGSRFENEGRRRYKRNTTMNSCESNSDLRNDIHGLSYLGRRPSKSQDEGVPGADKKQLQI